MKMKAITLIQPWASLIVEGRKTIETRSWYSAHVGPLAIHAGKKVDREACQRFGYDPKAIPTGAVLGTANMTGCVRFPNALAPEDEYGDFTAGRYGSLLKDVVKFETPVPATGSLGMWNWDDGKAGGALGSTPLFDGLPA